MEQKIKLDCYLEEYDNNKVRLKAKNDNKKVVVIVTNPAMKMKMLSFCGYCRLTSNKFLDRNSKDANIVVEGILDNNLVNYELEFETMTATYEGKRLVT